MAQYAGFVAGPFETGLKLIDLYRFDFKWLRKITFIYLIITYCLEYFVKVFLTARDAWKLSTRSDSEKWVITDKLLRKNRRMLLRMPFVRQ